MLDAKYVPIFVGGFLAYICFMIFVGWFSSRGKVTAQTSLPAAPISGSS